MATRKAPTRKAPDADEPQVGDIIEYGLHGVDAPAEKGGPGMSPQDATEPVPFEIEVGSPVWERLAEEGKLGATAERKVAELREEQDAEDAALVE